MVNLMCPALRRSAFILLCVVFPSHFSPAQTVLLGQLEKRTQERRTRLRESRSLSLHWRWFHPILSPIPLSILSTGRISWRWTCTTKKFEAGSLNYLGRYYASQGQYYNAADYFLKCLNITGHSAEGELRTVTYYDLGKCIFAMRRLPDPMNCTTSKDSITRKHRSISSNEGVGNKKESKDAGGEGIH